MHEFVASSLHFIEFWTKDAFLYNNGGHKNINKVQETKQMASFFLRQPFVYVCALCKVSALHVSSRLGVTQLRALAKLHKPAARKCSLDDKTE